MDHKFKIHRTNPIAQYKNQLRRMILLADQLVQSKPVTMADHKSFYRYRAPKTKANDLIEIRLKGDLTELESLLISDSFLSSEGRTRRDYVEQCLIALFREITARGVTAEVTNKPVADERPATRSITNVVTPPAADQDAGDSGDHGQVGTQAPDQSRGGEVGELVIVGVSEESNRELVSVTLEEKNSTTASEGKGGTIRNQLQGYFG